MTRSANILDVLPRLARDERDALACQFVAPAMRGSNVVAGIQGVRCSFAVEPEGFDGWGVFQPIDHDRAALVRMATPGERMEYLRKFPTACLILCAWRYPHWDAVLANPSDRRFPIKHPAPVCFAGTAQQFDTVRARFDGERFLFESPHAHSDPDLAALLRKTLQWGIDPRKLRCPELTPGLRNAYAMAHRGTSPRKR
jgi:hypothetical protein